MTIHQMSERQWETLVAAMHGEDLDDHVLWRSYVEPVYAPRGCVAVSTRSGRLHLGTGMLFVMTVAQVFSADDAEAITWFRYLADKLRVQEHKLNGTIYYLPSVRLERGGV